MQKTYRAQRNKIIKYMSNDFYPQHLKRFLILVIILIFVFNFGCIFKTEKCKSGKKESQVSSGNKVLTQEDKEKIDKWIKDKNLNIYGDPKDTMYTGGTPLFDESTGKTIDRYEYILKNHQDLPEKLNLSIK